MSIRRFLAIVAASVFLIGTLSTANAFAEGWKPPVADHEARIGELETNDGVQDSQLVNHESRIGDAENKNTTQDGRLDTLEQNQTDLQSDVADHEGRIHTLENQPAANGGIKVNDSSDPPQFVGLLVSTVPQEISSSPQDLLVQPHITVFVPSLGKFLETYWSGEHLTYRTQIPALYFDGPDCSGTAYTDRDGGSYVLLDNEYYLYEFKDEFQAHTFYTISRYTGENPPVIQSMKWRVKDCENYVEDLSAYYPLTMVNTTLSFPFQQPLTFE